MHLLPIYVLIFTIIAAVLVLVAKAKVAGKNEDSDDRTEVDAIDYDGYVREKYLLSKAEYSFYKILHMAIGSNYCIQSKVRIGDLITVQKGTSKIQSKRNKIDRKHVDFVLCDLTTMAPLCAIELDDRSHDTEKVRIRDEFVNGLFAAVKFPCLRIPAAKGYAVGELKALIEGTVGSIRAA